MARLNGRAIVKNVDDPDKKGRFGERVGSNEIFNNHFRFIDF